MPNDKLLQISDKNTSMLEAFSRADEVLKDGVEGISSLISDAGLINLDFADVKTVMSDKGIAHMGVGVASGENRVEAAIKNAVESPLLETSIKGAKAVLLNIMGGYDLGMLEVNNAADFISRDADEDAIIIFGTSIKEDMHDEIRVTVIATGFEEEMGKGKATTGLAEETAGEGGEEVQTIEVPDFSDRDDTQGNPDTDFPIPPFLSKNFNF